MSLRGSAVALTADDAQVIVAAEDHEALFVLPASLAGPEDVRVVPLPGPPAEVVALDGLVLATVRTLPTDAARAARDAVRGPLPTASGVRFLEAVAAASPNSPRQASAPAASASSRPAPSASAANSASTKKAPAPGSLQAALRRERNTPARPFDPAVVRKSQGGLLVFFVPDATAGLREIARVVVAPDAWGLAVSPNKKRALVTSAWSGEVALVDLETKKVLATQKTAREPRGVVFGNDAKTAYVSHLIGSALTKLELAGDTLVAARLELPPARWRTLRGTPIDASLAYSLVLSPDGESLYVPRHALGAEGVGSWWGTPTVDVLDVPSGKPLAPERMPGSPKATLVADFLPQGAEWQAAPGQASAPRRELVQPRAVVYRKKTDTLLVAGEGWDAVSELDALAVDPALAVRRVHALARAYDALGGFPDQGGAPSGIALERSERFAYVYCRTTFDLVRIDLDSGEQRPVALAKDGLPADAAYGRRLFANAKDSAVSGGLACAGCHPEGRDDGYVWRETEADPLRSDVSEARFVAARHNLKLNAPWIQERLPTPNLYARQTPMLAGRMRANGPYGWHAEAKDIVERLLAGFALHRATWEFASASRDTGENIAKIDYLADYLRSGLLPPPTLAREPNDLERRGKAIFESAEARCSACHRPDTEFTDRAGTSLRALPARKGFDAEARTVFKTPSLWFVGGTAPYFHDGSAATLEELVQTNGNRMGDTRHLSADEQRALVSYLRTL